MVTITLSILMAALAWSVGAETPAANSASPSIEDYATIEGYADGAPIYSFSNLSYVYGVSPDLLPGAEMQEGNRNPKIKIKPKKSWEIKHNLCGATHEMTVRSPWADSQPFLPIHLIDGDPDTVWCSWGSRVPDEREEWIRIDLPMETTVGSVALVCSPNFYPRLQYGRALPKQIEIRLSRDAWHWETVYRNADFAGDASGTTQIKFEPRPVKQVWLLANQFPVKELFPQHIFSIGEVQIRDPKGNNLALISRGAGVTVSSTSYGIHNDYVTQAALWGPLQYDLGNKWVRVGPHNGSFTWGMVEREKGKLQIDPWADESISECARNGVNVIMNLDYTMGNWRYANPPRKLDWRQARFREINNNYEDSPPRAYAGEESWNAFLRYVDYMARQFKDRVTYWEIANEWNVVLTPEKYMDYFEDVYDVIKKAIPDARIMLGNTAAAVMFDDILYCLGQPWKTGVMSGKLNVEHETMFLFDGVEQHDVTIRLESIYYPRASNLDDDGESDVDPDELIKGRFGIIGGDDNLSAHQLGERIEGQFGIVLRYTDADNYVAAFFNDPAQCIFFSRITDGQSSANIAQVNTENLGNHIRFQTTLEDGQVTFTVSDGGEEFSTRHRFDEGDVGGPFGYIFQFTNPKHNGTRELLDHLEVIGDQGEVLLREEFEGEDGAIPASLKYIHGDRNPVAPGWAKKIDAVGWHSEGQDWDYVHTIKKLKEKCRALGFEGSFFCPETGGRWLYPPGPPQYPSEMVYAKQQIRRLICNNGMGIQAGPVHPHMTGFPCWITHVRLTWPTQTIIPANPASIYYVWRTIATVTDDFYAREFPVSFTSDKDFLFFTFESGDREELMLTAFLPGVGGDGVIEEKTDIVLPGLRAAQAWAVESFNGTQQELDVTHDSGATILKGIWIKDYPTFIRLKLGNS